MPAMTQKTSTTPDHQADRSQATPKARKKARVRKAKPRAGGAASMETNGSTSGVASPGLLHANHPGPAASTTAGSTGIPPLAAPVEVEAAAGDCSSPVPVLPVAKPGLLAADPTTDFMQHPSPVATPPLAPNLQPKSTAMAKQIHKSIPVQTPAAAPTAAPAPPQAAGPGRMPDRPESPLDPAAPATEELLSSGTALMAEVQARCDALKGWYDDAARKLEHRERSAADLDLRLSQRDADLDARRGELDERDRALDADRATLEADRKAFRAYREAERQKLELAAEAEAERVAAARAELQATREKLEQREAEVMHERALVEEEWNAVAKIRRATERLEEEWSTERARMATARERGGSASVQFSLADAA